MSPRRLAPLFAVLVLAGCDAERDVPDADDEPDGGTSTDAGHVDASGPDPERMDSGAAPSTDAGALDARADASTDAGSSDAAVDVDGGAADPCAALAGDPRVQPAGFVRHDVAWEDAFYGNPYPTSGAPLAPIGSFTLRESGDSGPTMLGRYLTIPFVPEAATYQLEWTRAQPIAVYGYGEARVAPSVYVVVSRCPGDFRRIVEGGDPALGRACRKTASQTSLYYSSVETGSNLCPVRAGETHYINIVFSDPAEDLSPAETTCAATGDRCEINAEHRER